MGDVKKVIWRWDYGVYMPFCPNCDDILYVPEKACRSCKQAIEWTEPKYKETVVEIDEYTVVQATNNHISIYENGKFVFHASCRKKMTETELKDMVEIYKSLGDEKYGKNGT